MKDVKIITARDLKKLYAVKTMLDDLLEGTDAPRRVRRKKRASATETETPPATETKPAGFRKRTRARTRKKPADSEVTQTEAAG